MDHSRVAVRARWIFPVNVPPIENGALEICDGRISAVHNQPDRSAIDLGNVALIPGLVNCHTHLEFSDLAKPVQPSTPFSSWIGALMSVRRGRPITDEILEMGIRESHNSGTVAIGEIATSDWNPGFASQFDLSLCVFRELIGVTPERAVEQLEIARNWLKPSPNQAGSAIRKGLSPHAPYTVYPELYHQLIELARSFQAPVAVHLAETTAELELLSSGRGDLVEMLRRIGVWSPSLIPSGTRIMDYLRPLESLTQALVIHGNYLDDEEIDWLAAHKNVFLVFCPRTHAYFGHSAHPYPMLLKKGGRMALGTDSRGSNPDLDLWKEVLFLRSLQGHPDDRQCLELATICGAQALGIDAEYGTLAEGKRANVAVVPLDTSNPCKSTEPYEILFQTPGVRHLTIP